MGPINFPLKLVFFLYRLFSCAAFIVVPLKFLFFNDVSHLLDLYLFFCNFLSCNINQFKYHFSGVYSE